MSVDLVKDWLVLARGSEEISEDNLSFLAIFYGVEVDNSANLLGDIAAIMGYNETKFTFGMPYIQYISKVICDDNPNIQGGSYLQTIVNYLS